MNKFNSNPRLVYLFILTGFSSVVIRQIGVREHLLALFLYLMSRNKVGGFSYV